VRLHLRRYRLLQETLRLRQIVGRDDRKKGEGNGVKAHG
jgi:hypothetical protein